MRAIDRAAQTNRWRRRPAAEKALTFIGLMLVSLIAAGWIGQIVILMLVLCLVLVAARVAPRDLRAAAVVPAGFILAGTAVQMITLHWAGGPEVVGPVVGIAGPEMLSAAAFTGLRSITCVACLIGLALTTPLTSLLQMVQRRGLAPDISDLAMMMFRIVWLVLDCLETGQRAQAARLGHAGWGRQIRSGGRLLAGLLPRVLDRAQRMNAGLAVRGYDGRLRFAGTEAVAAPARLALLAGGLVLAAAGAVWIG